MSDTDTLIRQHTQTELEFAKLKELFEHPAIAATLDRIEKVHTNLVIEAEKPGERDESRAMVRVVRVIRNELTAQAMQASVAKNELKNLNQRKGK